MNSPIDITIPDPSGDTLIVSGSLEQPTSEPRAICALAHGAGAPRDHHLMDRSARLLLDNGVAVLRYNFPYMELAKTRGKRGRPDPPRRLEATVRAAVDAAARQLPGLPILAAGRSMGGRMSSQAQSKEPLPGVVGLVFFAFPLHSPAKPGIKRADHLFDVKIPMLFLNGTRDALAQPDLLSGVCDRLGPVATLASIEGADHSFAVLKRSGRTPEDVDQELSGALRDWLDTVLP
jgi:predicted alpha/beta-hydrolase family hydrolase